MCHLQGLGGGYAAESFDDDKDAEPGRCPRSHQGRPECWALNGVLPVHRVQWSLTSGFIAVGCSPHRVHDSACTGCTGSFPFKGELCSPIRSYRRTRDPLIVGWLSFSSGTAARRSRPKVDFAPAAAKWITGRRVRSGCTVHPLLTHSVAMIVPTSASIASMAKKTGTTLGSKKKLSSAQIMSR